MRGRNRQVIHNYFAPDCFLSFSLWISLSKYGQLLMKNKFVLKKKKKKKSKTHETKEKKTPFPLIFMLFWKILN